MQNAECRVKGALVGAIHESPENERIFVYSKPTGRGGAIFAKQICHGATRSLLASSRKQTHTVNKVQNAECRVK